MSGEDRREAAPQGPPWSPNLLADFQAGLLDPETHETLRARVDNDPQAQEVLAALDTTRAELRNLPSPPLPGEVTERIETALRNEAHSRTTAPSGEQAPIPHRAETATVTGIGSARKRPGGAGPRVFGWVAGLVATAAAVLGAVVVATSLPGGSDTQPRAATAPPETSSGSGRTEQTPLALRGDGLGLNGEQFAAVLGSEQYTGLSDPSRLPGCLQANGVSHVRPLGAREITLNGQDVQLLVLPTGRAGEFRLLAVGPECGPGQPATIADTVFGG
ncbi:hypothetical protein DFQ14_101565 [Halopolyspora algeriensis]|uniref:Anti-sigma-M factor RsmA n=1 Tax=Halopolyspora algeriensis TaxID=1500506 RepID=A0A368W0L5_9ACTN|nr:hypothetical protein [Halopolyspora algeriensis]RCW47219.1 hypothetical protein DFQ14_101565 [Halopolyspora algeriensis]TQM48304.1 hypothetical protein FHU43_3271 [Halopolyspora algeriensis]